MTPCETLGTLNFCALVWKGALPRFAGACLSSIKAVGVNIAVGTGSGLACAHPSVLQHD